MIFRIQLIIIVLISIVLLNNFASAQDLNYGMKTLNLLYIDSKSNKSETLRIEIVADDCISARPLKVKLNKDMTSEINSSHTYTDYVIIKIWDDNLIKDKLLGEIKVEKDNYNEYKTVQINNEKLSFALCYRVSTGNITKDLISSLRHEMTELTRKRDSLKAKAKSLNNDNSDLRSSIESLQADLTTLQLENNALMNQFYGR